jgi:hypothetical protein
MQQDSSMLSWFPKIADILPVPRTVILPITIEEAYEIIGLLDDNDIPDTLWQRIEEAAAKIGYPLFLRSDHGSAKHDYSRSCHVVCEDDLKSHLACLFEWHLMRDLWPQAIVFRELLDLNAPFKAFHGLPIAKERRYFVDGGKVICHHPYWPQDAVEEYQENVLPTNWQDLLSTINAEDDGEIARLTRMAEAFAENIPGFYSVDFAQKSDGQWVMIDAARGELSYHPSHDGD